MKNLFKIFVLVLFALTLSSAYAQAIDPDGGNIRAAQAVKDACTAKNIDISKVVITVVDKAAGTYKVCDADNKFCMTVTEDEYGSVTLPTTGFEAAVAPSSTSSSSTVAAVSSSTSTTTVSSSTSTDCKVEIIISENASKKSKIYIIMVNGNAQDVLLGSGPWLPDDTLNKEPNGSGYYVSNGDYTILRTMDRSKTKIDPELSWTVTFSDDWKTHTIATLKK